MVLAALAERRPIEHAVALVVAHPDDETLAAGGSLHLFRRLLLVHVTDGAPRRLADSIRAGFPTPEAYAAARARELDAALAQAGAAPLRAVLGVPDQEVADAIPWLVARLRALFTEHHIEIAITHPYEGGHPDHDATALAVRAAAATEVLEFAGYHAGEDGGLLPQTFLPLPPGMGADPLAATIMLPAADLARKQAMLACFRTQADILRQFDPATERFRIAPRYDFTRPPHPGRLLYEEWGWMAFAGWRERVGCPA